jgi:hypothetical protein
MSNDTPSWLSNDTGVDAAPASSTPEVPQQQSAFAPVSSPPVAKSTTTKAAMDVPVAENDEKLSHVILFMRILNMAAMVTLTTCSIVKMMSFPSLASWVLACYAICTSTLVFCLETQLKFIRVIIAMNFGFLFNPFLRFIYYMLMASIAWSFDDLFGQIVGVLLICVAFYNTYVLIAYPDYRRVREKIALDEDKRIEDKISKQVQREAMNQAGKSWNTGK